MPGSSEMAGFNAVLRRQSAFTLIEIIVTIIVIGISATALMSVFTNMIRGSADPVIQQQAATIAEAYLEEIMLRAFDDPQVAESGGAEAGETRPGYDDVQDYNSLGTTQVRDQNNNPVATLSDYQVTVTVSPALLNSVNTMQIDVSVNHPVTGTITLSAFRADY
ncbi:MAG: prepilin-type N-terminal cleavage/methylation domain-containing protein [Gammaproteobacteria bacterium]|nr:prepilin-type N-terminal cleavage/methylation domain-containing protein [Gammaproteobacteria bacterium]